VVQAAAPLCTPDTLITADAGYHSEANLKALAAQGRPALIADNQMRKRDERFKDQGKYKALPDPLYDKVHPKKGAQALSPPGLPLRREGRYLCLPGGQIAVPERDELPSQRPVGGEVPGGVARLRSLYAARPVSEEAGHDTGTGRCPSSVGGRRAARSATTEIMKRAIDSERGRELYGGRFATVEPVFGNLRYKQGAGSLHPARADEGGYAVEALLPGAQHREAGAPRSCTVGGTGQNDPEPPECGLHSRKVGAGGTARRKVKR
jgi:hypothetical protein